MSHPLWLHARWLQKAGKQIQSASINRIGDHHFVRQILGLGPGLINQGVIFRYGELGFVTEYRKVSDTGFVHRIRRDHEV